MLLERRYRVDTSGGGQREWTLLLDDVRKRAEREQWYSNTEQRGKESESCGRLVQGQVMGGPDSLGYLDTHEHSMGK